MVGFATLSPSPTNPFYVVSVPALAIIKVKVYDKDENQYLDDYVGKFKITDVYVGGQRDIPITSLLGRNHGTFRIEVIIPGDITFELYSSKQVRIDNIAARATTRIPCLYVRWTVSIYHSVSRPIS